MKISLTTLIWVLLFIPVFKGVVLLLPVAKLIFVMEAVLPMTRARVFCGKLARVVRMSQGHEKKLLPYARDALPSIGAVIEHVDYVEPVFEDMMEYIHIFGPHLKTVLPILDKLGPHMQEMMPLVPKMEKFLNEFIPYARERLSEAREEGSEGFRREIQASRAEPNLLFFCVTGTCLDSLNQEAWRT
jgi:hypothetical protein